MYNEPSNVRVPRARDLRVIYVRWFYPEKKKSKSHFLLDI